MTQSVVRILLIEDNPGDARLIRELLQEAAGAAFEVHAAQRLATGLARLQSAAVDVILLDLGLPDSVGIETFRSVCGRAPDVPVIVLTGLNDESVAVSTLREGAQDYLIKGQADGALLERAIRYAIRRKQAEGEIRSLNENLERRVRERTSELEAANSELHRRRRELQDYIRRRAEMEEALKAANQELEAFTYSVSHDLRAPIRQIDGFSRMLTEYLGDDLDPKARHYLERIQQGTRHMGRLVDDLLHLARVGRQAVRPRLSSLDAVVTEVLTGLQGELAEREIEWRIRELPSVECDPGLMKVALTNLLDNAVKYTRPRRPAVIEVGSTTRDGRAAVYVRDNGVGFDMKYADKLFGVFQRLHRADEFEGTGVGLATVQRIIHKHGGEIWAEAEREHGATFYFTLGHEQATVDGNGRATAGNGDR